MMSEDEKSIADAGLATVIEDGSATPDPLVQVAGKIVKAAGKAAGKAGKVSKKVAEAGIKTVKVTIKRPEVQAAVKEGAEVLHRRVRTIRQAAVQRIRERVRGRR